MLCFPLPFVVLVGWCVARGALSILLEQLEDVPQAVEFVASVSMAYLVRNSKQEGYNAAHPETNRLRVCAYVTAP